MSERKHTPGPWKFIDATKEASMQFRPLCVIRAGTQEVAAFSWNDNSPYFPTKAESQANARLIAAAPDLLASLKAFINEIDADRLTDDETHNALMASARAALSKAGGA